MLEFVIGIAGMFLILLAFVLDEFHKKWTQETVKYNLTNIFGAGLLLYYAFTLNSLPFMILNGVWVLAAVIKLVKIVKK